MLYLIDTEPWSEADVKAACGHFGIEFKPGFDLEQTKTKLASTMLKHAVAEQFQTTVDKITLSETGKPQLEGENQFFNIAHHKNMVVAATSTSGEVGIDLTDFKTPFTQSELEKLFDPVPADGLDGIYWATREAYLKYTGEGVREGSLHILTPSHSSLPALEALDPLSVMPMIKVENQYAKLFKAGEFVGSVIAPKNDLSEVNVFSNEKKTKSA